MARFTFDGSYRSLAQSWLASQNLEETCEYVEKVTLDMDKQPFTGGSLYTGSTIIVPDDYRVECVSNPEKEIVDPTPDDTKVKATKQLNG